METAGQCVTHTCSGCVPGHGADVTVTEPLTAEKLSLVGQYWRAHFSRPGEWKTQTSKGSKISPQNTTKTVSVAFKVGFPRTPGVC